MTLRPAFALLLPALLAVPGLAQGKLEITPAHLDLGVVDAAKGPIPFTLTLKNVGDADLNLGWVDTSCSCVAGDPDKGILAPGASTVFRATFDPARFSGPYRGQLEVHSDGLLPLLTATFQAQIRPDFEPSSPITACNLPEIHFDQSRVVAADVRFQTRSGATVDPSLVIISPNASYLGAKAAFKGGTLVVTPYLEPRLLPKAPSGNGSITVAFRGASLITYSIPVDWHRADPVQISTLPNGGGYRVVFEDHAVKVKRLKTPTSTRFTVSRSRDGHTITLTPVLRHPKSKVALPTFLPGEHLVLITDHPTRPEVTITCAASSSSTATFKAAR